MSGTELGRIKYVKNRIRKNLVCKVCFDNGLKRTGSDHFPRFSRLGRL